MKAKMAATVAKVNCILTYLAETIDFGGIADTMKSPQGGSCGFENKRSSWRGREGL